MTEKIAYGRKGNALMEYALPMTVILLTAGVLATVVDIQGLLGKYFMASSGHTTSSLDGNTFKPKPLTGSGELGNGSAGFNNYGVMLDGNGNPMTWGLPGQIYTGSVDRTQVAGGNGETDWAYPIQINWGPNGGGPQVSDQASNELQARVIAAAETTRQMGAAQQSGDNATVNYLAAQLAAQQAGAAAYAARNYHEVVQMNPGDFQQFMAMATQSLQGSDIGTGYSYNPWEAQQWQQEEGLRNENEVAPAEIACSADFSSCHSTATGAAVSYEQLFTFLGIDPEAFYGAMINSINNQAATPVNDDSFSRWWISGSNDQVGIHIDEMTAEYYD